MQNYPNISPSNTLTESRELILSRDDALLSCFAGDEFPSTKLTVGMLCHRTDLEQTYQLKSLDGPSWQIIADLKGVPASIKALDDQFELLIDEIKEVNTDLLKGINTLDEKTKTELTAHDEKLMENDSHIEALNERDTFLDNKIDAQNDTLKEYVNEQTNSIAQPAGSISLYTGLTLPEGWLECNGQAVSRTSYANLFGVLDTTYGAGDGEITFNLPDMRGRVPMGVGQGDGLSDRTLNQKIGAETHTLTEAQMPKHGHQFLTKFTHPGRWEPQVSTRPSAGLGPSSTNKDPVYEAGRDPYNLPTGGSAAHPIMQPSLGLIFMVKT